jgi:hypothetical protein
MEVNKIDLSNYIFLEIIDGNKFIDTRNNISGHNLDIFNSYDIIMSHKSALSQNEQDIICEYCSRNMKSIVFFSGGISTSFYEEIKNPILHINSKEFYSSNLVNFLNNILNTNEINIKILQFGDKWKLNNLLNVRDKLKFLIYNNLDSKYIIEEDIQNAISPAELNIISNDEIKTKIEYYFENGIKNNFIDCIQEIIDQINHQIKNEIQINL